MSQRTRPRCYLQLEALEQRCTPTTISDFLNAQGTTSVFNYGVSGLPDEAGWGTSTATVLAGTGRFARFDYTGQDAAFLGLSLGTTTSGTVSQHRLSDGREQVTVNLHTRNAFAWAQKFTTSFDPTIPVPASDLLFGVPADRLAANPSLTPALGNSHLQLVYKAAPGATPPDIVKAFVLGLQPGYDLVSISFRATAQGTTPTGQPATLVVSQTGVLFRTPELIRDFGFTAEVVAVHTHGGASPAMADGGPAATPADTPPLTQDQLQLIVAEGLRRWEAAGADTSGLGTLQVQITDLPGAFLGQASLGTIWIDLNAAGWGWFLDPTPWEDAEFVTPGDQGEQGRMDLLTVLVHELGHLLGYEHADGDDVMAETLTAGTRRMPAASHAVNALSLPDVAFGDEQARLLANLLPNDVIDALLGSSQRRKSLGVTS